VRRVADAHDLHAWTLTSGMHVVSAHVVMRPGADPPRVLDELCGCLAEDFEHSTIQVESLVAGVAFLRHSQTPIACPGKTGMTMSLRLVDARRAGSRRTAEPE
jgi:hypothetical protein